MSLEAMKMAWWALCLTNNGVVPDDIKERREAAIEALRQAIEQAEKPWVKTYCGGKPNYCTPEVSPEVAGEDTGEVGACVTCGAPKGEWLVDAVNMKQERVDETAKREHEPWPSVQCVCGGTIYFKYTPPISDYHEGWEEGFKAAKREWVGLTEEEMTSLRQKSVMDGMRRIVSDFEYIRAIEAKLKEKNNG